jgi:transcriptional regulator with XRE-family HTH domain
MLSTGLLDLLLSTYRIAFFCYTIHFPPFFSAKEPTGSHKLINDTQISASNSANSKEADLEAVTPLGKRIDECFARIRKDKKDPHKATGVGLSSFRSYAYGLREPSVATFDAIAKASKVDLTWLIRGEGEADTIESRYFKVPKSDFQAIPKLDANGVITPGQNWGYLSKEDLMGCVKNYANVSLALFRIEEMKKLSRFFSGEWQLVDITPSQALRDGDYLLRSDAGLLVRQVAVDDDGYVVVFATKDGVERFPIKFRIGDFPRHYTIIGRFIITCRWTELLPLHSIAS